MRGESRKRASRFAVALVTAVCVLAASAALAAAEDATSIFGKDGIATQSLGVHFEETQFSSVEARADGGVIAKSDDQLESYLANGAPDPAAPPQRVSRSRRVFQLAGGKRLVAAEDSLTRVNADGSADLGFGGSGTVKSPFWTPQAAVELPSGEILVASVESGGLHTFFTNLMVAVVNQDGSIDRDFGTKGVLTVSLAESRLEGAAVIAIVPTADGGVLMIGGSFLYEMHADGSPNSGFGSDGLVTELPPIVGGRTLADGSIELVGSAHGSSNEDLAVLHYTAAGSPDSGFGPGGVRTFDLGGDEQARAASWAPDGSVVVGGVSIETGSCSKAERCEGVPVLAGFDPDGGLDSGFGSGGVLRLTALASDLQGWYRDGVNALTRRPDGSFVAVGGVPPEHTVAFLAAFSPQGVLLPEFGEGGIARVRRAVPATQQLSGLVRLANDKLLAAGTTDVGTSRTPVLIRYDVDGSLDSSFGSGAGYVPLEGSNVAMGFAVNGAGQSLVGVYGYPYSRLLLRAADGAPVPTFGSGGSVQLPKRVRVEALGFAPVGDAIVAGGENVAGTGEPGIVLRFRPDGRPNLGFGRKGRVEPRPPGSGEMRVRTLLAGREGILVAGSAGRHFSMGRRFALTRLLADGRPDHRFGAGGWALANAGGTLQSVKLTSAGSHLYLAGVVRNDDRRRVELLRFDSDGHPDLTFGRHGRCTASIPWQAQPAAIVPSRGGTLVVLNKGSRPLLRFARNGKVRRSPVGSRPRFVENVRATTSGSRLLLGWNAFSHTIGRSIYHLASRALR